MSDEQQTEAAPTVRDRMQNAGLSAASIERHAQAGRVALNGEPVDDLDTPAPPPARVNVLGS